MGLEANIVPPHFTLQRHQVSQVRDVYAEDTINAGLSVSAGIAGDIVMGIYTDFSTLTYAETVTELLTMKFDGVLRWGMNEWNSCHFDEQASKKY